MGLRTRRTKETVAGAGADADGGCWCGCGMDDGAACT